MSTRARFDAVGVAATVSASVAVDSTSRTAELPLLILVIGRTADGKSSILREVAHPDENGEEIAVKGWPITNPTVTVPEGTWPNGTTKELNQYSGKEKINGRDVLWIDTPGIGDGDVGVAELLALLQEQFDSHSIDLLVVTHKLTKANLCTSRQIAMRMMDLGLVKDAWKNVIIVGTHRDTVRRGNIIEFEGSVVPNIFQDAGGVEPQFCYTRAFGMGRNADTGNKNKDVRRLDVSELLQTVRKMCDRGDHVPIS